MNCVERNDNACNECLLQLMLNFLLYANHAKPQTHTHTQQVHLNLDSSYSINCGNLSVVCVWCVCGWVCGCGDSR